MLPFVRLFYFIKAAFINFILAKSIPLHLHALFKKAVVP